jgi:putative protease
MMVDGRLQPLADARYLLSPGDLYALEQVPEIVKIGVAALKIEGRYKDAEYVALTTRAYRKAVDDAWAGGTSTVTPEQKAELEQVYSRGLGPFFMTGTNHQAVVNGRAPRHRGVRVGQVTRVTTDGVQIDAAVPVKPGDGIVFDAADWRSPQEPEEGGRIYEVFARGNRQELRFASGAIRFDRIRAGDLVWRTHDPDLDRAARPYLEPAAPVARQTVNVRVIAREGEPLVAEWSVAQIRATVKSDAPLSTAQNRALSLDVLRDQFGRLGNTPYQLGDVALEIEGSPFVPVSMLNQLRREAIEQLQTLQTHPRTARIVAPRPRHTGPQPTPHLSPALHLLVRTPAQLDAAIELRPASITLDYLDLYGLRPSIERVKSSGIAARVASPRVLKPGERRIIDFLKSLDCAILVRSAGMLEALSGAERIGDFSLNAANSLSAESYLALGLTRITPTHDLNAEQVTSLASLIGSDKLEAIAYQHLPVFHTEHCVFCRFLSTGTSYRDCGRPCESHVVQLKDENGRAHPVMADVGCRNTVFGAEAQEASAHISDWLSAGIGHFRLEFVHESPDQLTAVTRAFEAMLTGKMSAQDLATTLKKIAPQSTTEGSLFVPKKYLELPILQ